MGDLRHVRTKLVGVTFPNADGSSRQALIARCRSGERLTLRHEPNNPADDHAVAVYNPGGEQLGHLRRKLAHEVVARSADGTRWAAYVSEVTGGYGWKRSRGCNVLLVMAGAGEESSDVDEYARAILEAEAPLAPRGVMVTDGTVEYESPAEKRLKWPLTEYLKPVPLHPRRARPALPLTEMGGARIWRVILIAAILAAAVLVSLALVSGVFAEEPTGFRNIPFGTTERQIKDLYPDILCFSMPNGPHGYVACTMNTEIGDAKVHVSLRLVGEPGERQLASVGIGFSPRDYEKLRQAFIDRYGAPTEVRRETLTTRMGAAYEQEKLYWIGATTVTSVSRYGSTVDRGYGAISTKSYGELLKRQQQDKREKARKDL